MQIKLNEYIKPNYTESRKNGRTCRNIVKGSWEKIITLEMDIEAEELKDLLIKMYKEKRFVEAIYNGLVWCNSYNYAIDYDKDVSHIDTNKLKSGLKLKSGNEVFIVTYVTKNGMIARIQNIYSGKITSHTVEEIAKYFKTLGGETIEDTHCKELKRMKYSVK